jgi:hypothetical protein
MAIDLDIRSPGRLVYLARFGGAWPVDKPSMSWVASIMLAYPKPTDSALHFAAAVSGVRCLRRPFASSLDLCTLVVAPSSPYPSRRFILRGKLAHHRAVACCGNPLEFLGFSTTK